MHSDCAGGRGSASPSGSPSGQQQPGGPLGDTAPHYDPSQGVPVGPGTEQDAEAAYYHMELLSQSIRNELQRDLHIHDSAVLPNFVNLPQVCTPSFCIAVLTFLHYACADATTQELNLKHGLHAPCFTSQDVHMAELPVAGDLTLHQDKTSIPSVYREVQPHMS